MKDLRLDTLGRILAGQEAGRVVEIVDDAENTGGFLILTYSDLDRSPEVYDSWVDSIVDVELYFDEKGWTSTGLTDDRSVRRTELPDRSQRRIGRFLPLLLEDGSGSLLDRSDRSLLTRLGRGHRYDHGLGRIEQGGANGPG